jgi:hypothetical protein
MPIRPASRAFTLEVDHVLPGMTMAPRKLGGSGRACQPDGRPAAARVRVLGDAERPVPCALGTHDATWRYRTERVRARKLRQRRWRCVTDAADRRRRDRRLCPCQLRAGELCAVRGKAPLLICSGAASRRGLPYGGSTRFYGGSTRWQGHLGRFTGAAAAVRGLASSSGRLSLCFPDD